MEKDRKKVPTLQESSTNIFRPPAPHSAQYQLTKHCPAIFKYSPNLNSPVSLRVWQSNTYYVETELDELFLQDMMEKAANERQEKNQKVLQFDNPIMFDFCVVFCSM